MLITRRTRSVRPDPAKALPSSGSMIQTFVLTRQWRCGRPAKRLATASGLYGCHKHPQPEEVPKDVFKKTG
jgi:hypothetical protein